MFPLSLILESRRIKRRPSLPSLNSSAIVDTELTPRGSVLVNGELWTAEAAGDRLVPQGARVTVVGFRNHLLLVEEQG
jgi:membrane-bound ClpP family serine protease